MLAAGPLCNNGKVVIFDKEKVHVMQNDHRIRELTQSLPVLLQGNRIYIDGCWDIPVSKRVLQQNNYKKPLTYSGLYARRQNILNSLAPHVHENTFPNSV